MKFAIQINEGPYQHQASDSAYLFTKSLAAGILNLPFLETSKENLEHVLGLPRQDPEKIHRAEYDARYQALILQRLLDLPPH